MDYSRLLQKSNLAARQPQGATSVIQAITSEGLAQGPYVAARGRVEPATFRTEGTDNHHLTNHATCQREDEMVIEWTGHPPSYAKAKKMKSLTLHTHGY